MVLCVNSYQFNVPAKTYNCTGQRSTPKHLRTLREPSSFLFWMEHSHPFAQAIYGTLFVKKITPKKYTKPWWVPLWVVGWSSPPPVVFHCFSLAYVSPGPNPTPTCDETTDAMGSLWTHVAFAEVFVRHRPGQVEIARGISPKRIHSPQRDCCWKSSPPQKIGEFQNSLRLLIFFDSTCFFLGGKKKTQ